MRRLVTIAAVLALLLAAPAAAQAAFPGRNGKIAYLADGQYQISQVFTINPDGSGTTQVPPPEGDRCGKQGVSWSPDGSLIAIGRCAEVAVFAPDGSGFHEFGEALRMGSWSPDGTRLVYVYCQPSGLYCLIRRINADGSGDTTL